MLVEVSKPSTIYISFTSNPPPRLFLLRSVADDEIYYFRYLNGNTPRIKFNIPDPGQYESNCAFNIIRVVPIEIPEKMPVLPPAVRDRWKDVTYSFNPNINNTPIRIFTETGIIEYGPRMLALIKPVQIFLDFHEKGHFFYTNEEDCDLYALVNFLNLGYNQSTALYTLSHVLHRSKENIERLKSLFNHIQKIRQ